MRNKKYICPNCGKGSVEEKIETNFSTKIGGVPFVVEEAYVGVCNKCGRKTYSAKEILRWAELFAKYQEESGAVLSPTEIKEIREVLLGMSVTDFALFLGCTRQSVHNWENPKRKAPQIRSVDLLLRIIREAAATGHVDVIDFLNQKFRELRPGQTVTMPKDRRLRVSKELAKPADAFDRYWGTKELPQSLPRLQ